MFSLVQDLRFAARVLLKSPGFFAVAVLTLALGIASNTTVFSWIDTVLLRPIPGVSHPAELAAFETLAPSREALTTSYLDYRDFRDHLRLVSGIATTQPRAVAVGDDTSSDRVWTELVSGNYFEVLGVKPMLGRVFAPAEYADKQGAFPVAVISEGLWRRMFRGDPAVIGTTIRVNEQQLTIVGVVPKPFHGAISGLAFEMWIPVTMATPLNLMPDWMLDDRQTRNNIVVARLAPGVTLEQATAEAAALADQLARQYPRTNEQVSAILLPLWKGHFGAQSILLAPLRILMAVGGVVLLIVCANVANLLLARSTARQREYSIRAAMGAGRLRLIRQMLTEGLLLALAGAVVGIPLALWAAQGLGSLLPPGTLPISFEVDLNANILAFTLVLTCAACLVSGLAPAFQLSRVNLENALRDGGRSGSAGSRSHGLRRALVACEVALALVAIIGAGLFARSFQMAQRIDPGFEPRNVVISHLQLASAGYRLPDRKLFCRRLRERLEAQPGVIQAAYADIIPMGMDSSSWEPLQIEGYVPAPGENLRIDRDVVSPGYFSLMKIPVLAGRDFTELDEEKSQQVMIVTQTFARRFFGGRDPIGRRVRGWGRWFTVVGVVKDSKYRRPDEDPRLFFYVPFRQVYREDHSLGFLMRVQGDPAKFVSMFRNTVRSLDPNVGVFDTMPMTEYITASMFAQKVAALLLGILGGISLLLAAVGLYSVMAYAVTQRTQEIGIRMALGARTVDVLGLVLRQGMALTLAGIAAGAAVSIAVTRLAQGMLVQVSPTDPLVFLGGMLFLGLVALAATVIPARRASRIDPNEALRAQ